MTTVLVAFSAAPTATAHVCVEGVIGGPPPACNGHACRNDGELDVHVELDDLALCVDH